MSNEAGRVWNKDWNVIPADWLSDADPLEGWSGEEELTPRQEKILAVLRGQKLPMKLTAIAEALGISKSALQREMAELESLDAVARPDGPRGGYSAS